MDDKQLVDSIIGTLKHYGYNADRKFLDATITAILIEGKDSHDRLIGITTMADLSLVFDGSMQNLPSNQS